MHRQAKSKPLRLSISAAAVLALTLLGGTSASLMSPAVSGGKYEKASGSKAVPHHAGGHALGSKALRKRAPVHVASRLGIPSLEPTIGVTADGKVFTTAFQASNRIEVLRSADRGKSWDLVSPQLGEAANAHFLSFDPYTYVDLSPTDRDISRVFTIDLTVACAYLSFSDDGGDSWTTNPLACGRPVNDHQTLFGGPPVTTSPLGYPNLLYYCWNDVLTSSCSKSIDGGVSFVPTKSPAFTGTCGGLHGHGHVGSDGTVYIPKGHCGQPWLAISTDEGDSWTQVQVADNGVTDHEAGVATDGAGNIYYTYVGQDRLPYLVVSRDQGKSWSKPKMIGAPGVREANLPSIAVGGRGKVAIAYMGSENSPWSPGAQGGLDYSRATWNGYVTITANALAKNPLFYSSTVNPRRDPLIRRTCGPGRCQAVYDFIDVTIDRHGMVWSAWVDGCLGDCIKNPAAASGSEGLVGYLKGGPRMVGR